MQIKKSEVGKVFEKLTQKDFKNLIDCPLSLEEYETILKEKSLI